MKLSPEHIQRITSAEAKALGTYGPHGVNVIPVSTVKIFEDHIVLVNYFMNKTVENLSENNKVSLSCWTGFDGIQIKAEADYQTEGHIFEEVRQWAQEAFPDRTVGGVIILTPLRVFSITPNPNNPGAEIN